MIAFLLAYRQTYNHLKILTGSFIRRHPPAPTRGKETAADATGPKTESCLHETTTNEKRIKPPSKNKTQDMVESLVPFSSLEVDPLQGPAGDTVDCRGQQNTTKYMVESWGLFLCSRGPSFKDLQVGLSNTERRQNMLDTRLSP